MENLLWGVWGWILDRGPILWEVVDFFPNEVCEDSFRKLCHLRLTQNYHDLEKIYDLEKINVEWSAPLTSVSFWARQSTLIPKL